MSKSRPGAYDTTRAVQAFPAFAVTTMLLTAAAALACTKDASRRPPDAGGVAVSTPPANGAVPSGVSTSGQLAGLVAFMHPDGYAAWIEAREGATLTNVSAALEKVSPGKDTSIATSLDGAWFALNSTRFECGGWDCLIVAPRDLASAAKVLADGKAVHPDPPIAVGPGGAWVVYADKGPSHERDLFITRRSGSEWSAPKLLTGASAKTYNTQPAPSHDGKKIAFDCSAVPYGAEGTGICEVGIDGTGLRALGMPGGAGWSAKALALHHPAYAPDGSVVVEMNRADTGERIWRLPVSGEPVMLGDFGNDNSPCVLPSGWIASLYLTRPGNQNGVHELKLMGPGGAPHVMVLTGFDVVDVQLSCGK